jgi:hypothetical protein
MKKVTAAASVTAVVACLLATIGAQPAHAAPTVYDTPGSYTFTVPAGMTQLTTEVYGAEGGRGMGPADANGSPGGEGGRTRGTIAVSEGQTFTIRVGGKGANAHLNGGAGGSTGSSMAGGKGGNCTYYTGSDETSDRDAGGGGAASFVVALTDIGGGLYAPAEETYVIAGGGGGGGGGGSPDSAGGAGGGGLGNGGNGSVPIGAVSNGTAAGGGTQSNAGTGGTYANTAEDPKENGADGTVTGGGGDGGTAYWSGGGGGGGGYFGGGGGGTGLLGGSGAGGSGTYGSAVTNGTGANGVQLGNGKVLIGTPADFGEGTGPSLKVLSPNGGESWPRGTTRSIKFEFASDTAATYVKIALTRFNKVARSIAVKRVVGSSGEATYNWAIPIDLPTGGGYRIRVTIRNSSPSVFDSSNATFSITS